MWEMVNITCCSFFYFKDSIYCCYKGRYFLHLQFANLLYQSLCMTQPTLGNGLTFHFQKIYI